MDGQFSFTNYGQERDLDATPEELQIFDLVKELAGEPLQLVRKSGNYVSAELNGIDVARFKCTKRARWIRFPYTTDSKIPLAVPEDVSGLGDEIRDAVKAAYNLSA